jgi:hypothetical protein
MGTGRDFHFQEQTVICQIRIYTINKGSLDEWMEEFHEKTMPIHASLGIPIVATWVNRPQNEFIWVRTFENEEQRDSQQKAFRDAATAAGMNLGEKVAKMEIRETEQAFSGASPVK